MLVFLTTVLRLEGHHVEVFSEARPGLECALDQPFDLVLLDLDMPVLDGFEVLTALRERFSMTQLPVIMLTGHAEAKNIMEAINLQANGYVTKPVDMRVLKHRIQQVLSFKRQEQARHGDGPSNGLPTRPQFFELLAGSLGRAKRRPGYLFAVICLDLDRFNVINDALGHALGGALLGAVTLRLQEMLRPGDAVTMLENREFMVLLDDIGNVDDVTAVASKIQQLLSRPFTLLAHEVVTTASIGIVVGHGGIHVPSGEASAAVEALVRDAHTAMLAARAVGGARHETFESTMHARAARRLQLEADLRRALERRELVLYYQPLVALQNNRIVGFEALVRWVRPNGEITPPGEFIPLAEESGLIGALGLYVTREACMQARRWQLEFADDPPLVSINLSGKQFLQADLYEQIEAILTESGVDCRLIEFEITESAMMHNADVAADVLTRMKKLDLHLAIDDFGTGYSSLSYLHRFPFDVLKIDRSFVIRLGEDEEAPKIVQTILLLAHNLGLQVVAEGVETVQQLRQLRKLGLELVQGYYFSRPVASETAGRLLAESRHLAGEHDEQVFDITSPRLS